MPLRTLLILPLLGLLLTSPLAAEETEARARRLINALGCKGCHSFEGSGASLAPALDRVGARLDRQGLRAQLTSHQGARQEPFMPSYATTPAAEMDALLNFLAGRK